jgi:AraC-like DNA-binding protein
MDSTARDLTKFDDDLEHDRQLLAELIERLTSEDGGHPTSLPNLFTFRYSSTGAPTCSVYEPVLAVVVRGAKRVTLGDETLVYDQNNYLITSVDLPVRSQIIRATDSAPYLCVALRLNIPLIAQMIGEIGADQSRAAATQRGIAVSRLPATLLNAVLRYVQLAETPDDQDVLAPLIEREIHYRLLTGAQGAKLRQIAQAKSHTRQIAQAIEWLRGHYDKPLKIETLAKAVNMSASSLHHHFKTITMLSPLQYMKQLRLQEARRLMLTERLDAATAGHRVGYESPSQFSREYSRHFGAPPLIDVKALLKAE